MLRRKDDVKEWRQELIQQEDVIQGIRAPEGIPCDDLPDIPEGAVEAPKPKRAPAKKKVVKKAEEKAE